jgi:anti-sigma factor RsiW
MTCKEFLNLMYLRDDELDGVKRTELERHRSTCAACASEYARVESSRRVIHDLSLQVPKLTDPLIVTNSVIGRIENDAMKKKSSHPESMLDRWIVWLSAPGVRAVMAGLLLLITGSFAVEYTSGFVRMKGYEETLEKRTALEESYATAAGMDSKIC